jgi:hypothetical protein
MLAVRKQQKAFGRGSLKMLTPSNRRILPIREYTDADGNTEVILCVANVSRAPRPRNWNCRSTPTKCRWRCSAAARSRPSASCRSC